MIKRMPNFIIIVPHVIERNSFLAKIDSEYYRQNYPGIISNECCNDSIKWNLLHHRPSASSLFQVMKYDFNCTFLQGYFPG